MPTDEELITALRSGMQDTTGDLNPAPGLAAQVWQQSRKARGRRLAAYVAVPVVAAAATAIALLVSGGSPAPAPVAKAPVVSSSTAVVSSSAPVTRSTSAVTASPAAYKFAKIAPLRSCPTHSAAGSVGKSNSGAWLVTPSGQCFSFTVDWGDGPPADAKPLNIPGYPDLYGVTADAYTGAGGIHVLAMSGLFGPEWAVRTGHSGPNWPLGSAIPVTSVGDH